MASSTHRKDPIFTERLSRAMNEQKIYPKELDRKSGVDRKLIYSYLNGVNAPSTNNLRRLAKALNVSADFLLGNDK